MIIVALSGWKGSGKDTLAEYMIKNYNFKKLSFAESLKDLVSKEYGVPREHFDDLKYKEKPILSLPVVSTDRFSEAIHNMLSGEFKKENGEYLSKQYSSIKHAVSAEGQLYWTPRALAILKGNTNRSVNSSYWVNIAIGNAKKTKHDLFVISDLRFKSEVDNLNCILGGRGATYVRINRFKNSISEDPSERDLDDFKFDYYINNTGNKQNAFLEMDFVLENII
jgi:hypothetical protein